MESNKNTDTTIDTTKTEDTTAKAEDTATKVDVDTNSESDTTKTDNTVKTEEDTKSDTDTKVEDTTASDVDAPKDDSTTKDDVTTKAEGTATDKTEDDTKVEEADTKTEDTKVTPTVLPKKLNFMLSHTNKELKANETIFMGTVSAFMVDNVSYPSVRVGYKSSNPSVVALTDDKDFANRGTVRVTATGILGSSKITFFDKDHPVESAVSFTVVIAQDPAAAKDKFENPTPAQTEEEKVVHVSDFKLDLGPYAESLGGDDTLRIKVNHTAPLKIKVLPEDATNKYYAVRVKASKQNIALAQVRNSSIHGLADGVTTLQIISDELNDTKTAPRVIKEYKLVVGLDSDIRLNDRTSITTNTESVGGAKLASYEDSVLYTEDPYLREKTANEDKVTK